MNKVYLCIDLKSFFASVECVERGLDPMKSNLVVADFSRGKGAICLAVSPHLKELGVKNRCRVYEIPDNIDYITAIPRMKKYIEYSANIYAIYLKYLSKDDIHVYSIDEAFLDITSYLKLYKKNPFEFAEMLLTEILDETGITGTAGIGTNLYLAKIALDILAKHSDTFIGYLDEDLYIKKLGNYTPLSDFWQIGKNIERRLNNLGIYTMNDISKAREIDLYREFGINAKLLIDHSKGVEPTTIEDIKNYKPKQTSISTSQILFSDYNYTDARKVLVEMLDTVFLEMIKSDLYAYSLNFFVGYSKDSIKPLSISRKLKELTNSFQILLKILVDEYNKNVSKSEKIRRLGISLGTSTKSSFVQLNMFDDSSDEKRVGEALNNIKSKYGKSYIFRGVSLTDKATGLNRNKLIGGHNAE